MVTLSTVLPNSNDSLSNDPVDRSRPTFGIAEFVQRKRVKGPGFPFRRYQG